MITLLQHDSPFPPVEQALRQPNGLLAAGGDLMPERLLDAYRHGIFPWFSAGDPILWWSPDPRMVLFPDEFKISHSLDKTLRRGAYEIRTDTAFEQVMRACASPREGQNGTWIQEEIVDAYVRLHHLGLAHSVETWMDAKLVGGLYGVSLGRMFYGESMFSRKTDASKIALAHLSTQLKRWNFGLIDCQMNTPHLATLGAREIPRREFLTILQDLIHYPNGHGDIATPDNESRHSRFPSPTLPLRERGQTNRCASFTLIVHHPGVSTMTSLRDIPLSSLQFYLTAPYQCSYLEEREARSQVATPSFLISPPIYSELMRLGFRRSGTFTYRPHCDGCHACVPVRVPVNDFSGSRTQRRMWKKNQHLQATLHPLQDNEEYFDLYRRYQQARHPDGGMSNDNREQYQKFLLHSHVDTMLVEFREEGVLRMVSIIDALDDGLSSVYTFFEPDIRQASYGTYNVLWQIELCRQLQLPYLYLGYWIEQSRKMSYKAGFQPLQGRVQGEWQTLAQDETS